MAEKHTVAMFIQEDGERKQVGWASPAVDGARTFEFSPGYADKDRRPSLKNVSFEDDELSQKIAAEEEAARLGDGSDGEEFEIVVEPAEEPTEEVQEDSFPDTAPEETSTEESYPQAGDEGKDSAPLQVEPNEELAAEPVENLGEETVELDNGGAIVDTDDDEDTAPAEVDEAETVRQNQQRRQNNQNRNRNNRGGNRNQGGN